jgi:hypothetical protein
MEDIAKGTMTHAQVCEKYGIASGTVSYYKEKLAGKNTASKHSTAPLPSDARTSLLEAAKVYDVPQLMELYGISDRTAYKYRQKALGDDYMSREKRKQLIIADTKTLSIKELAAKWNIKEKTALEYYAKVDTLPIKAVASPKNVSTAAASNIRADGDMVTLRIPLSVFFENIHALKGFI